MHSGTITPTAYLTYLFGGNAVTGTADGTGFAYGSFASGVAIGSADPRLAAVRPHRLHDQRQHRRLLGAFEFRVRGCTSAELAPCTEGHITDVYMR